MKNFEGPVSLWLRWKWVLFLLRQKIVKPGLELAGYRAARTFREYLALNLHLPRTSQNSVDPSLLSPTFYSIDLRALQGSHYPEAVKISRRYKWNLAISGPSRLQTRICEKRYIFFSSSSVRRTKVSGWILFTSSAIPDFVKAWFWRN